jgi:dTDP-4-dehydrorhamnose reductase
MNTPKKVLLTGANGLLGQKLVALLHQHPNFELLATSRGAQRLSYKALPYQSLDLCDAQAVAKCLASFRPDYVIHTAAMTNVDACELNQSECWQQNVEAVRALVQACEAQQSFLLHLSTDFIFDGSAGPYREEALPSPISYYGESKAAAEKIVQESKLEWAIARTVLVYGLAEDMSRSNIILWVKKSLEEGKKIQVVDDQWRTPTLAEDLAQGCMLIVEKHKKGIFNISGAEMMSPYDIALATADFFELDASLISRADASTFSQPAKRPPKTGFIIEKAQTTLGYRPHSFREGLALLASQLSEHSVR